MLPVKTHACRPLLQSVCADERGHAPGHALENGFTVFVALFPFFDLLPVGEDLLVRGELLIAEHMGMAAGHLLDVGFYDVLESELSLFLGDSRVENNLEQEVAELLFNFNRTALV